MSVRVFLALAKRLFLMYDKDWLGGKTPNRDWDTRPWSLASRVRKGIISNEILVDGEQRGHSFQ
jgi:hypothetical protein